MRKQTVEWIEIVPLLTLSAESVVAVWKGRYARARKSRLNRVKTEMRNHQDSKMVRHQVKKEQLQNKLAVEFETKKISSWARERPAFRRFLSSWQNMRLR